MTRQLKMARQARHLCHPERNRGIKNDTINNKVGSLYIHIPFCKKKCNYCDFVSYAGKEDFIDEYVEKLVEEINSPPPSLSLGFPPLLLVPSAVEGTREGDKDLPAGRQGSEFATLFFGGGTPTLLSLEHFNKIINNVAANFSSPSPNGGLKTAATEVSLEANPGTADLSKLKALRQLGINRLSIGCQSFNDQHLKTLGRIHNTKQAIQFYNDAREAGFENINLDLIFSLPNQTLDEWKKDLQTAIDLGPEHLSCYSLQVEEGTPFWQMTNDKLKMSNECKTILETPSEDEELAMYEYTIETLTKAGYKHYEISNFAKPDYECQHNINYWKMGNWIGIGAGAHSHVDGKHWANSDSVENYISAMVTKPVSISGNGNGRKTNAVTETGIALPAGRQVTDQRETIFMGLRLLNGIPTDKFKGFEKEVTELIEQGLLAQDQNNYKLTRKGLYLGNMVFEKFV